MTLCCENHFIHLGSAKSFETFFFLIIYLELLEFMDVESAEMEGQLDGACHFTNSTITRYSNEWFEYLVNVLLV